MMKKTLLSIMTMAALVSSTTATAETKDIIVSAEIPHVITVQKNGGGDVDRITLEPGFGNAPADVYGASENIAIRNGGADIKVNIVGDFKLQSLTAPGEREFTELTVILGGEQLKGNDANKIKSGNIELVIHGKKPSEAIAEEKYSGTLKLNLEPVT
ncbi:CS1 type fimbrial major subunit [Yersinia mollaretii]|uniref:CS1 type fimbrial major subunit n=1 Tax=Yersinia mollaretii TaxID=33060 RepID=UPI00119E16A0|nr:CS1 type fimbrial major subunit [Yersinia mollaretii]